MRSRQPSQNPSNVHSCCSVDYACTRGNMLMLGGRCKTTFIVCILVASLSTYVSAKCPVAWVEVHGRVQCSFKPDDKVLITLLFSKHQEEGMGEETALSLENSSFDGRVVFDMFSSRHFLTGDRCNRRPKLLLIRLISADGGERDRKVLKFPDNFDYSADTGQYRLRPALMLSGWCEPPKCPQVNSQPCQKPH